MRPSKERGRRRPNAAVVNRKSLLVFTEGEATEPLYLTSWLKRFKQDVTVEISAFHGVPLSLVKRAVQATNRSGAGARAGRGRAHDEVWCVFDIDEHPSVPEAKDLAARNGVRVAISNPCFELWLLWHYRDQTAHIHRHAVQAALSEHTGCGKRLDAAALSAMESGYPAAKERAIALDRKHDGDRSPPGENPSSGAWRLVESIRTPKGI